MKNEYAFIANAIAIRKADMLEVIVGIKNSMLSTENYENECQVWIDDILVRIQKVEMFNSVAEIVSCNLNQ